MLGTSGIGSRMQHLTNVATEHAPGFLRNVNTPTRHPKACAHSFAAAFGRLDRVLLRLAREQGFGGQGADELVVDAVGCAAQVAKVGLPVDALTEFLGAEGVAATRLSAVHAAGPR
ncbi:hypothetical protein [Micromonospora sp. WMMD1219]|uniref:hypothetical protein n=1 Tax=Micromonospora sp. WMMD1219 TaxID=3404115 RepID=UPI003BF5167F